MHNFHKPVANASPYPRMRCKGVDLALLVLPIYTGALLLEPN